MGRNCEKWAEKQDDLEQYKSRQKEVSGYWEKIDEDTIKPILAEYDPEIRGILEKALWLKGEASSDDGPEPQLELAKSSQDTEMTDMNVEATAAEVSLSVSEDAAGDSKPPHAAKSSKKL